MTRTALTLVLPALLVALTGTPARAADAVDPQDVLKVAKDLENLLQAEKDTPLARCKTAWDLAGKLAHDALFKMDDRTALLAEAVELEKAAAEAGKVVKAAIEKKYLVVGNSVTLAPAVKALIDQRKVSQDDQGAIRKMTGQVTEILLRLGKADEVKGVVARAILTGFDEDWKAVKDGKDYERQGTVLENYRRQIEAITKAFPDNKDVQAILTAIDQQKKEIAAELEKAMAAKEWAGHAKDFQGPGDVEKLAASCMEYFRNSADWGRREGKPETPVAVSIRGNWISVRKNIIDETTQWGLPITVAVRRDWGDDKGKDIAVVFEVVMLTADERGVQKAPPWSAISVGNITRMRLSKVPQAAVGNTPADKKNTKVADGK